MVSPVSPIGNITVGSSVPQGMGSSSIQREDE